MSFDLEQIKISVIMPTYNVSLYLHKCLQSVINSTLQNIEIIVIDDGSTDDSWNIIRYFAEIDKRIKPVHVENGGYGKAVNIGLSLASGKYISIIETDDWIDSNMYRILYDIAEETKADIIKGNFYSCPSENIRHRQFFFSNLPINTKFNIISHPELIIYAESIWSAIYNRQFLIQNSISFVETPGASYQDHPFAMSVYSKAHKIILVDLPLYFYRNEPGQNNSSNQNDRKLLQIIDQIKCAIAILHTNGIWENVKEAYFKKIYDIMLFFISKAQKDLQKDLWLEFSEFFNSENLLYYYFNDFEKKCINTMKNLNYSEYIRINKQHKRKYLLNNIKYKIKQIIKLLPFIKQIITRYQNILSKLDDIKINIYSFENQLIILNKNIEKLTSIAKHNNK